LFLFLIDFTAPPPHTHTHTHHMFVYSLITEREACAFVRYCPLLVYVVFVRGKQ
jgi:hypothetical protein